MVDYSDTIAICKAVFYGPALLLSAFVAFKHGFSKASGWIFLAIFCTIRITESATQLYLISHPQSSKASTTELVTSLLGLSPLLLASLGLLTRCLSSILSGPLTLVLRMTVIRFVQTLASVGLVLCIVGATSASTPALVTGETTVKIGTLLFLAVYICLCILAGASWCGRRRTKKGETALIASVLVALPFLLVRITYSLIEVFGHSANFSIGNDSKTAVTINLLMSVVEEWVVVSIYLVVGLKLRSVFAKTDSDGEQDY